VTLKDLDITLKNYELNGCIYTTTQPQCSHIMVWNLEAVHWSGFTYTRIGLYTISTVHVDVLPLLLLFLLSGQRSTYFSTSQRSLQAVFNTETTTSQRSRCFN